MNKKILICDVDNCISDDSHRVEYLPPHHNYMLPVYGSEALLRPITDEDFHAYHQRCTLDVPRNINELYDAGDGILHEILMVTAMPQRYDALRWWWFKEHLAVWLLKKVHLLMRPNDDHTPSPQLKVRMLKNYFRHHSRDPDEVVIALDDRQDVLDAYKKEFNFPTKRIVINE